VTTTTVSSTFVTKTPEHLRKKVAQSTKRPKLTRQQGKSELVQKALFGCPIKVSDFKIQKEVKNVAGLIKIVRFMKFQLISRKP